MRLKSIVFSLFALCATALNAIEMHVCTVASHHTEGLSQLLNSCKHYDIPITVMGLGLPYPSNGQKLNYFKEFLQRIPDEDVVLFVDGYDVLILAKRETILEKFFSKNIPCIFSAEINLYPPNFPVSVFPQSPTKFRFLNSGTFMGYAHFLKKMLDEIEIKKGMSDQRQLTKYFLAHQSNFLLDYQCELFLALHDVHPDEVAIHKASKTVDCLTTHTTPCMVHGNGNGKEIYQKIYNELFGLGTKTNK